ncbi:hypothetical protein P3S67_029084 [Capsicum chacoense]
MHIVRTEAVSALFAREYDELPVELSTQQIADQMPRDFNYAQRGRERDEILGSYYGSHVDGLHYAMNLGLFEDRVYPKRETSWDVDFPNPLPNEVKYKISSVNRVRTADIAEESQREGFEDLVTAEEINTVLMYEDFVHFKGEEVYMGPVGDEVAVNELGVHSILIIGWGIKNVEITLL